MHSSVPSVSIHPRRLEGVFQTGWDSMQVGWSKYWGGLGDMVAQYSIETTQNSPSADHLGSLVGAE